MLKTLFKMFNLNAKYRFLDYLVYFFIYFSSQVPSRMMDMSVLMATQFLLKQVSNEGNNHLLSQLYQYLLFDFKIWSHSHFAVCLGNSK